MFTYFHRFFLQINRKSIGCGYLLIAAYNIVAEISFLGFQVECSVKVCRRQEIAKRESSLQCVPFSSPCDTNFLLVRLVEKTIE